MKNPKEDWKEVKYMLGGKELKIAPDDFLKHKIDKEAKCKVCNDHKKILLKHVTINYKPTIIDCPSCMKDEIVNKPVSSFYTPCVKCDSCRFWSSSTELCHNAGFYHTSPNQEDCTLYKSNNDL